MRKWSPIATVAGVPALIYLFAFCLLTFPLIRHFSTHLFADAGDGLQNLWNLWWFNKAVTELHRSPWWTPYLHHPFGVSLLGHTLTPFNGLLGIPLLAFWDQTQVYNILVLFAFVASGLTAFWLAYYCTRSYWPSILAGGIFTFSSYHFAHMEGHLNLISIECLPVFVLCWYALITRPGIPLAVASAVTLFAVLLSDYYYFLYAVLIGILVVAWQLVRRDTLRLRLERGYARPMAVFLLLALASCGPLVLAVWQLDRRDPLSGGHPPASNSMDALAPFIPGSHWRFAALTRSFWSALPGDTNENSVYLGWAVVVVLIYVAFTRRPLPRYSPPERSGIGLWFSILLVFGILALGPTLHVWGREVAVTSGRLPYALLERIIPPLRLSGVPVRMASVAMLAASVLCAIGFARLTAGSRRARVLAAVLLVLLVVEYLPKRRVLSALSPPAFVRVLQQQPGAGGVLDTVSDPFRALYYQTIHQRPIAFGVLSRIPASVIRNDEALRRAWVTRQLDTLHGEYRIRYVVTAPTVDLRGGDRPATMVYRDADVVLYDLSRTR